MKIATIILSIMMLSLSGFGQTSEPNMAEGDGCKLETWGVFTYRNFTLLDSVYLHQGSCNGVQYYSIDGAYSQYVWKDNLLTVYNESYVVTKVKTLPRPVQTDHVKIKKRNILPDSIMENLDLLTKSDTINEDKLDPTGTYRIVRYKAGQRDITVKINRLTGRMEELVEVTSYRSPGSTNVTIERKVTRLVDVKNGLTVLSIMNPSKVIDLKSGKLSENLIEQGYSLFEL